MCGVMIKRGREASTFPLQDAIHSPLAILVAIHFKTHDETEK